MLIDNWTDHGPTFNFGGPINLSQGQLYDLTMEYYENGGGAAAILGWEHAQEPRAPIPASQLYPMPVCVTPPWGTVSWWPGNGNGSDIVGGNDATLQAGAAFAVGKVSQNFSFDGANSFVQVSGPAHLAGPRTVEAWVYPHTHSGFGMPVVTAGVGGAGDMFGIAGTSGNCNIGQYELYIDHWGTACLDSGLRLTRDAWNHVAFTYDGTTVRFYLNGVAGASFAQTLYDYNINTFTLGGNSIDGSTTQASLDGSLDEMTIYSRALSPDEIKLIYVADTAGKCGSWLRIAGLARTSFSPGPTLPRG